MIYAAIPVLVAVLALVMGRRVLTLLLILAYLAIEGFLKLVSNYNPVVHVGLDIVVLALTGWLAAEAVVRRRGLPRLPWTWLIGLYTLWIVLQVANPNSPGLVASIASFKVHLAMIPLYFIAAGLFRTVDDVRRFLIGVVAISLVPYALALIQYALGPASVLDLSPRAWQNISYYHEWRPFGTSAVPGGASVFAFLALPLTLVLLGTSGGRWSRVLAVVAVALGAGAFIVSGVRQTLVGCILAVTTMAALMLTRRRGAGAATLATTVVLGMGAWVAVQTWLRPMATESVRQEARVPEIWRERDVSERLLTLAERGTYTRARVGAWSRIVDRATRYPLGAGLGRTGSAAGALAASLSSDPRSASVQADVGWSDNFFADMIAEAGIPGLVMLTAILLGMLLSSFRLARQARDPTVTSLAASLNGFYVAILAMSWGSQPLLGNPITAYFWVLSGLLVSLWRMEADLERAGATADEPRAGDLQS